MRVESRCTEKDEEIASLKKMQASFEPALSFDQERATTEGEGTRTLRQQQAENNDLIWNADKVECKCSKCTKPSTRGKRDPDIVNDTCKKCWGKCEDHCRCKGIKSIFNSPSAHVVRLKYLSLTSQVCVGTTMQTESARERK